MYWIISTGLGKKFILLAISLELTILLGPTLSVIPAQAAENLFLRVVPVKPGTPLGMFCWALISARKSLHQCQSA